MDTLIILGFFFALVVWNCSLSGRIRKCEQLLAKAKKIVPKQNFQTVMEKTSSPPSPKPLQKKTIPSPAEITIKSPAQTMTKRVVKKNKTPKESFKIPDIIQENWMGVFGSIALVIGAVFFGLTSEIMQHAEVRVGMMIAFSLAFIGVSLKLRNQQKWTTLCGWLQSVASTVILFATLGAGGIPGLQFIHSPLYALGFLSLGILVNILLALRTPYQTVASLHVVLSLIAFCLAPQGLILLPMGAIVACIGLTAAYHSRWDLHLILIVAAFAFQNWYWTSNLDSLFFQWAHYLAIASSVAVGMVAACVHYSKKYQSPKFEPLPFVAHLANWSLLAGNIWLHTKISPWTPCILGLIAIAGFILAQVAKKKNILWLYRTDTLLAQMVALSAIASLSTVSIDRLDISLIALSEIILFNYFCSVQKETLLLRIGYCFQYICSFLAFVFSFELLSIIPLDDRFPVFARMGVITVLNWGYHYFQSVRLRTVDDFRFVFYGKKEFHNPVSIMAIFGTLFFLGTYCYGFYSIPIQILGLSIIGAMAVIKKLKEDASWNISLMMSLIVIHYISWETLTISIIHHLSPDGVLLTGLLGITLLDIALIFGNFLRIPFLKKNIHDILIYTLGIHIALLTYAVTNEISELIPGLAFLGFSILSLEIGRFVPKCCRYSDEIKHKISGGMTHIGLGYLFAFIGFFVTVHMQVDPIWKGISLRWITEFLGISAIVYWISSYPKKPNLSKFTRVCGDQLVELALVFFTLCAAIEVPELWRPSVWAIMAIGLLFGSLNYHWPKRLNVYSWLYMMASIVHVAFVTSTLTMPSLFWIERFNFPTLIAIALQLCFACLVQRNHKKLLDTHDGSLKKGITQFIPVIFAQPCISTLLPVFLGIALLLAFNFERAILTFLWVGLIGVYLSVGLFLRSKLSIQIAMGALLLCSIRLIAFDMTQSDLSARALVFIGVGGLMLGMSVLYKKFKHRIEAHEAV